jgi:hypothetical protein
MGIITLTLVTTGTLPAGSAPSFWVILTAGLAIALSTYLGGWRIIRILGKRITEIETPQGFVAETSSTAVIQVSVQLRFPLSTTQVISGAIFGAGAGRRLTAVGPGRPDGDRVVVAPSLRGHCRCPGRMGGRNGNRGDGGRRGGQAGYRRRYLRPVPTPADGCAQRQRGPSGPITGRRGPGLRRFRRAGLREWL